MKINGGLQTDVTGQRVEGLGCSIFQTFAGLQTSNMQANFHRVWAAIGLLARVVGSLFAKPPCLKACGCLARHATSRLCRLGCMSKTLGFRV